MYRSGVIIGKAYPARQALNRLHSGKWKGMMCVNPWILWYIKNGTRVYVYRGSQVIRVSHGIDANLLYYEYVEKYKM